MTKRRIRAWVEEFGEDGVYVSLSGGKDSTVLLHMAREEYPDLKAVFIDTGLEYPEIRSFVKTFENVDWIKPQMNFRQVIKRYGYPFISKEVSECVQGARKYLTSIIEENSLDRPTDHGSTPTRELLERAHIRSIKNGTHHIFQYETDRILGTCGKRIYTEIQSGGTITSIANSEELANILNHRMVNREGGNNQRLAIMLGMLTKDKTEPIKANIPSKDRSQFPQERYAFFLDAPFEISNMCCNVMKKNPAHKYQRETGRKPITAQMASESRLRTQKWLQNGCNAFDAKKPISNPMSFWTEQDVLTYIKMRNIPICSLYGDVLTEDEYSGQMNLSEISELFDIGRPTLKTTGCDRTGCMFCGFGCHLEKSPSRFERMKETHPKQYEYIMRSWENGGLNYKAVIDWINENGNMNIKY